jgi:uncharacterized protein
MTMKEQEWFTGSRGSKEAFLLRMGEMPNGGPYFMPVLVVTGNHDGPTFFVNASLHGDEVLGSDIVRGYWKALDPARLSGRFVGIPMANYAGVSTRTRRNIIEMYPGPHDMNRVFPGNAKGMMTERIAATIMEKFIMAADFSFDIHSASVGGEWLAYTQIPGDADGLPPELTKQARALGQVFGTRLVLEGLDTPGSFVDEALVQGKVSSMVEFGVANHITRPEREFGCTGLTNLLTQAGMLPGAVQPPASQVIVRELIRMRTDHGGFLELQVGVGDEVLEGQPVATVSALDGEVMQQFTAPVAGLVCRVNTMAVVGTGDLVAYVGR